MQIGSGLNWVWGSECGLDPDSLVCELGSRQSKWPTKNNKVKGSSKKEDFMRIGVSNWMAD
jgi:hypothetical protein